MPGKIFDYQHLISLSGRARLIAKASTGTSSAGGRCSIPADRQLLAARTLSHILPTSFRHCSNI
jgi:hypothetical protein